MSGTPMSADDTAKLMNEPPKAADGDAGVEWLDGKQTINLDPIKIVNDEPQKAVDFDDYFKLPAGMTQAQADQSYKQHFRRIKDVKADGGAVIVIVKDDADPSNKGEKLRNVAMPWRVAAQRARGLNDMAHVFPIGDRETAFAIVEATIAACKEAKVQEQRLRGERA